MMKERKYMTQRECNYISSEVNERLKFSHKKSLAVYRVIYGIVGTKGKNIGT